MKKKFRPYQELDEILYNPDLSDEEKLDSIIKLIRKICEYYEPKLEKSDS